MVVSESVRGSEKQLRWVFLSVDFRPSDAASEARATANTIPPVSPGLTNKPIAAFEHMSLTIHNFHPKP